MISRFNITHDWIVFAIFFRTSVAHTIQTFAFVAAIIVEVSLHTSSKLNELKHDNKSDSLVIFAYVCI